jgi:hypothetical protein
VVGDGHLHVGVALHPTEQSTVGVHARLLDQTLLQKDAEGERQEHNHEWPADELAERELPAEQQGHDDPELDHEVRRGELECHRRREIGALTKKRPRKGDRRVGTRRGGGAETGGDCKRPWRVIRKQQAHLAFRDDRLHHPREREA